MLQAVSFILTSSLFWVIAYNDVNDIV